MRTLLLGLFVCLSVRGFAQPQITSFSPASGVIGTTVTITGSGFSTDISKDLVFFGSLKAVVNSASVTSLNVTVPAGAVYDPITFLNLTTGLQYTSLKPFIVTHTGGEPEFSSASFSAKTEYEMGTNFNNDLRVVDIDGDGKTDVLMNVNNKLAIRRNTSTTGTISYAALTTVDINYFSGNAAMVCKDMDGDGKPDVAIINELVLHLYRNTSTPGNISFAEQGSFTAPAPSTGTLDFTIADVTQDGKPDILYASYPTGFYVLKNNGTPGNISFQSRVLFDFPAARQIIVADIDSDGLGDVCLGHYPDKGFSVVRNTSSGAGSLSFSSTAFSVVIGGNFTIALSVEDLDSDGKPDMILGDNTPVISMYRNTSTPGTIAFGSEFTYQTNSRVNCFAVSDYNGDGKPDIASINSFDGFNTTISLIRNNSSVGAFAFGTRADILTPIRNPNRIRAADFDGDGKPDLVSEVRATPVSAAYAPVYRNLSPPVILTSSLTSTNAFSTTRAKPMDTVTLNFTANQPLLAPSVKIAGHAITATNTGGNNWKAAYIMDFGDPYGSIFYKIQPINTQGTAGRRDSLPTSILFDNIRPEINAILRSSPTDSLTNATSVVFRVNVTEVLTGPLTTAFSISTTGTVAGVVSFVSSFPLTDLSSYINVTVSSITGTGNIHLVMNLAGITDMSGNAVFTNMQLPAKFYTIAPPAPVINSFLPNSGGVGSKIVIKGLNFSGATAVKFGGVSAASFSVDSATGISAIINAGSLSGTVSVTTPGGTATLGGFAIYPVPTITSFEPLSAAIGGIITITGTDLSSTTKVLFGGIQASSFTVLSSTKLLAVVAEGSSGAVSVTTTAGTADKAGFIYIPPPPPAITSFTPASAGVGGVISVTGTNFFNINSVTFGGTAADSFRVVSPTLLLATVAIGTSGTLSVTGAYGSGGKAGFTYIPTPPPTITSFTPTSATVGSVITITGTNLNGAKPAVSFGGTAATSFRALSATTMTAVVGYGSTGALSVTTAGGTAALTGFVFVPSPPTIASFNPAYGTPGTTITVYGTSFNGTTAVSLGGTPVSTFSILNPTTLTAVVANGSSGALSVTTSAGSASRPGFLYFATPPDTPTITSFIPTSALSGATITITGTNFTGASAVSFGNTAVASFQMISSTVLTVVLGNGSSDTVRVTTPGGIARKAGFTFLTPTSPTLTSFTPASAAAGQTITITGTNLSGATSVTLGGTAVASFKVLTSTTIEAVVGSGTSGTVRIVTPSGNTDKAGFVFIPAPVITSFEPASAAAGATLTVTGINLSGILSATLGGTSVASVKTISSTLVTLVVGSGSSGSLSITTASGTVAKTGFVFIPPVTISSDTTFCKGTSVVMASSAPSGNQWYRNGSLITGATADTYTATTTGVYKVIMVHEGVSYPSVNQVSLTENPQPVAAFTITGDSSQCINGNLFTFTNTSTISGNDQLVSRKWILGDSLFSDLKDLAHTYKNPGSYQVKLVSISNRGCRDTTHKNVVVKNAPAVVVNNPAVVCNLNNNTTINLTAGSIVNGSALSLTYTYWKDSTATTSLTNAAAVSVSGTYYIKGTDTLTGCYTTKPVSVKINPLPVLGLILGDTTICLQTSAVLSHPLKGGTWTSSDPAVATIDSAGKVSALAAGFSMITYSYTATSTGCSNSTTVKFTVLPLPITGKPLLAGYQSDTLTCFFNSLVIGSKNFYDKYLWSNGATTPSVSISANASVSLKVGSNQNACYSESSVTVTARKNLTPEPTVNRISDNLTSSSSTLYKWLFNNKLTGDTTQSIPAGAKGIYNVRTSIDRVCWNTSKDYLVFFDPVTIRKTFDLIVYPNPTNGIFSLQIKFQNSTTAVIRITISDQAGVQKWDAKKIILLNNSIKIPVSLAIAKGTYVVKVEINGEVNTQQLVIM